MPDDLVRWIRGIRFLDTTEPTPVTIDGLRGHRFQARVKPLPSTPRPCGKDGCIAWARTEGEAFAIYQEQRIEFIVLDNNVGSAKKQVFLPRYFRAGDKIVILVMSPADQFDAFLPETRRILDTLRWN